jgi:hypothetical protein
MSKRFTETDIWNEDWFIEMPKEYKLFYFYLKDQCNHAGIWRPNLRIFEAINEVKIDLKKALQFYNEEKERIKILETGHWFLIDFFVFQYGATFNKANRVHQSIESIYNKEDIELTSIRGLKDLKDRVKEKDKEKDKINYKGVLEKVVSENEIILPKGFELLILEWLKYKSEKGQSYKETGLKTLIKTFLKDSNSNVTEGRKMLDYSMSKNYAGLFKEKINGSNQQINSRGVKNVNASWDREA